MQRTTNSPALRDGARQYARIAIVVLSLFAGALTACHETADPCAGVSCSGYGTCAVASGSPICSCNQGYHATGLSCAPDPPSPPTPCKNRECGIDEHGNQCGVCSGSDTCSAGQCVPAPAPPPSASLKVVNTSSITISYLYVSPSGSANWGPDQLGSHVIGTGQSFTLNNIPCPHSYDLKVQDLARTSEATRYAIPLTCGNTFTWTVTN